VTFQYLKTGHVLADGPDYCGEVSVAPIGLSEAEPTLKLTEASDAPLPTRARTAHKWSSGSVLVVGGAIGMTGAAVLAGKAALAFGAGAVGLAVPEESASVAAAAAPELLHHSLESVPDRYGTLVVGPGLGRDHGEQARKLIESWSGPVVVDADALAQVSTRHAGQLVVTPHSGEFKRIAGAPAGPDAAVALAKRLEATVLLKGNPTFITDGTTPWVVDRGGPELATIGTGDVLAGMLGSLLAIGMAPATAARSAAYWHGEAGRLLAQTRTVTARGLVDEIGRLR
jgi:NAD(P)H-hydrate epimerase